MSLIKKILPHMACAAVLCFASFTTQGQEQTDILKNGNCLVTLSDWRVYMDRELSLQSVAKMVNRLNNGNDYQLVHKSLLENNSQVVNVPPWQEIRIPNMFKSGFIRFFSKTFRSFVDFNRKNPGSCVNTRAPARVLMLRNQYSKEDLVAKLFNLTQADQNSMELFSAYNQHISPDTYIPAKSLVFVPPKVDYGKNFARRLAQLGSVNAAQAVAETTSDVKEPDTTPSSVSTKAGKTRFSYGYGWGTFSSIQVDNRTASSAEISSRSYGIGTTSVEYFFLDNFSLGSSIIQRSVEIKPPNSTSQRLLKDSKLTDPLDFSLFASWTMLSSNIQFKLGFTRFSTYYVYRGEETVSYYTRVLSNGYFVGVHHRVYSVYPLFLRYGLDIEFLSNATQGEYAFSGKYGLNPSFVARYYLADSFFAGGVAEIKQRKFESSKGVGETTVIGPVDQQELIFHITLGIEI